VSTRLENIKPGARFIGPIGENSAKVFGGTSVQSKTLSIIFLIGEGGIAKFRWKRPSE
jgi:hypothetical protein